MKKKKNAAKHSNAYQIRQPRGLPLLIQEAPLWKLAGGTFCHSSFFFFLMFERRNEKKRKQKKKKERCRNQRFFQGSMSATPRKKRTEGTWDVHVKGNEKKKHLLAVPHLTSLIPPLRFFLSAPLVFSSEPP